ncbi:uncharacterized protein [Branchiostoma lanceolatum]|uniref:uncharacterized protein n=1 Tax=Branchiostoma lanceolatum TaxID=7740 RepID=UPI0034518534
MAFPCDQCDKVFQQKRSLNRHKQSAHGGSPAYRCGVCGDPFTRRDSLKRHEKKHATLNSFQHVCNTCGKIFARSDKLTEHQSVHKNHPQSLPATNDPQKHDIPTTPLTPQSRNESRKREDDDEGEKPLKQTRHHAASVRESPVLLQEDPLEIRDDLVTPDDEGEQDNVALIQVYREKWHAIRTHFKRGRKVQDEYNFRLHSTSVDELSSKVWTVFLDQNTAFKLSVSFGFILRNSETGELRYYYACKNNHCFLEKPVLVENEDGIRDFLDKVTTIDILECARQQRPDSKWTVEAVPNVTFFVAKLNGHPIGTATNLPAYLVNSKAVDSLHRGSHGQYQDNLCFFRCLTTHIGGSSKDLEAATKIHYQKFLTETGKTKDKFQGVTLGMLDELERLFQLNIYVYSLQPNDEETDKENDYFAELVRRPLSRHKDTMYLNLYQTHFSYIKDVKKYAKSYACPKCGKKWKDAYKLNRHELTCDGAITYEYPGGAYHLPPTIFEKLKDEGIIVPLEDRYYPFRATYDIECLLKPLEDDGTPKLQWEAVHELLSVSVCSNVPEYTKPQCFVSGGDPSVVVKDMIEYLLQISRTAYDVLRRKVAWVFEEIERRRQRDLEQVMEGEKESDESVDGDDQDTKRKKHYLTKLIDEYDRYLSQLVVIGFNTGKYDLNAMNKVFFPHLFDQQSRLRPIKRNNDFMSIETEDLKFLDLSNYVAPGFSYAAVLAAYGCTETKGFFPYEWMDSLEKLERPELPPASTFYSKLKMVHISEEDYTYCQEVWKDHDMHTMKDFLTWYNNKDVVPMLEAVQRMSDFYKDRQIDMFKDGISVPGLTMKYLFMDIGDTYFTCMDNEDVYKLFKNNIVGGPSIIFHRDHQKGVTCIREREMKEDGREPKTCQKVIGYDANALYLWSLMQDMPTGCYIRRRAEEGFKREYSQRVGRMATQWLEWVGYQQGKVIRHKFNNTEKRIGPRQLPVDGFCSDTGEIFQFHGCYFHGHECSLTTKHRSDVLTAKSMSEKFEKTIQTTEYLRGLGYTVTEMWECQWRRLQRCDPRVSTFLAQYKTPTESKYKMSEDQIRHAICAGELFGVIECDISVPEEHKKNFEEMPPIFKNVDISIDDIGPFMKQYAETNNIMTKSRRSLIGSMFGKKILLATPLLQWYLEKGLVVSHIHQVLEYVPKACFRAFGDRVSDARRDGDKDKSKKIIADTMKLIGNSAYGKTVTNKEKQLDVEFCRDAVTATRKINTPRFRHADEVTDDFYEMQLTKKVIKFNLPLQIGFFVYQYAKLRMLEFYYDFMIKFVDRSDFQYCEMDTDSAYIAISADRFEDVIKPNMLDEYKKEKHLWFPRTDTQQNAAFDKRKPGLFKEEWSGDGIVGLCSKTYYCFGGDENDEDKFSCKGVSKKGNEINFQTYLNVLETQKSGQGMNRGFRVRDNQMFTYSQARDAFSYFYPKRQVLNDGVTTLPLNI